MALEGNEKVKAILVCQRLKLVLAYTTQSLTKLADTESVWALLKEVLQNEV